METLFKLVILGVIAAVVVVLVRGVMAFGKGGADTGRFSNRMMRWRVGLQFLAVILILVFVFLAKG